MNLKKQLYVVLMIIMMILTLTLSGCKKNQAENTKETETAAHATEKKETATIEEAEETTDAQIETNDNAKEETQDLVVYDDEYIEIPIDPENMETIPIGDGVTEIELSDYEKYLLMSGDEQAEYVESFESVEAFFDWYKAEKRDYEAGNKNIEINSNMIIDANG